MSEHHLETPEFPLESSGEIDGPAYRQAYEIGCGALVIRSTDGGHAVCLKLDRIGKEYVHHYLIVLDPMPEGEMALVYVDPEDKLFDCFATLAFDAGEGIDPAAVPLETGSAFENKDGCFIKLKDDPKAQKMLCYAEPATGLVRIRQERKVTRVHPHWTAKAKIDDEVIELSDLLKRFAGQL